MPFKPPWPPVYGIRWCHGQSPAARQGGWSFWLSHLGFEIIVGLRYNEDIWRYDATRKRWKSHVQTPGNDLYRSIYMECFPHLSWLTVEFKLYMYILYTYVYITSVRGYCSCWMMSAAWRITTYFSMPKGATDGRKSVGGGASKSGPCSVSQRFKVRLNEVGISIWVMSTCHYAFALWRSKMSDLIFPYVTLYVFPMYSSHFQPMPGRNGGSSWEAQGCGCPSIRDRPRRPPVTLADRVILEL